MTTWSQSASAIIETDDVEQARSEQVEAYSPPEPTFSPESVPEPDLNARSFINDSITEQSDHALCDAITSTIFLQ